MTTLRLSAHSIGKGDPLTLTIGDLPALADATVVGLELYGVEEAETTFRFATGLPAAVADDELVATMEAITSNMLREGHIYEVRYLKPADGEGNELVSLLGGVDFPRTFFRVKADPDEPSLTAEDAAMSARKVEHLREEMYAEPLGNPDMPKPRSSGSLCSWSVFSLPGSCEYPASRWLRSSNRSGR